MATVYLGTHWLSDVLLGWTAGLLVLLALPWCEPLIAHAENGIFDLRDLSARPPPQPATRARSRRPRRPCGSSSARRPHGRDAGREPLAAPGRPRHPGCPPPGPHTTRSERTPVTPVGSRRPPHADLVARGTTPRPAPRPTADRTADRLERPVGRRGRYAQPHPAYGDGPGS